MVDHDSTKTSVRKLLLLSIAPSAAIIGVSLYLKPPLGLLIITLTFLGYLLWIWINPAYRFFRAATALLAGYLPTRVSLTFYFRGALPNSDDSKTSEVLGYFLVGGDSGLADVAICALIGLLFWLDYKTRQENSLTRQASLALIRKLTVSMQVQSSSGGGHQVSIKDSPNTTVNFFSTSDTTLYTTKIDHAAELLKSAKPEVALEVLEELRRAYWDRLSDREKFRVYANLGHAKAALNLYEEAARWFIDAKQFLPNDEQALALEAAGFFSLGNRTLAHEKAISMLARYPTSEIGNSIRLRSDESSVPTESLVAGVPEHTRRAPEVVFAIYERALRRDEIELAVDAAKLIRATDEDKGKSAGLLGCALVRKLTLSKQGYFSLTKNDFRATLSKALSLLDESLARKKLRSSDEARFRYHRALVLDYDGQTSASEVDFRLAIERDPHNSAPIRQQYGMFLAVHGRVDDCIHELRQVSISESVTASLRLARMLVTCRTSERLLEAQVLLQDIKEHHIATLDEDGAFELAFCLGKATLELEGLDAAREALDSLDGRTSEFPILAARAVVYSEVESSLSSQFAREALALPFRRGQQVIRYHLALALRKAGANGDAVQALSPVVSQTNCDELTQLALQCAADEEDHAFVLDVCRKLRANGEYFGNAIHAEVAALEQLSEFRQAVQVIDESIERVAEPEIKDILRLRKSLLGIRTGQAEWVVTDPSLLPKLEVASPSVACNTATILASGSEPLVGFEYIYQYLRRNFGAPEPHVCLVSLLTLRNRKDVTLPEFSEVKAGCAVKFSIEGGAEQWIVIEEGGSPRVELGERSPDSALVVAMIGKKTREKFICCEDPIRDRFGEVREIRDKYSFRAMEIVDSWETRFSDVEFIRKFQIPTHSNGELDVQAFLESMEKLFAREKEIQGLMSQIPLSATHYAKLTNETIVRSIAVLGNHEELPIRCCRGDAAEFQAAQTLIANAATAMIEASALATLWFSGAFKFLRRQHFKLATTEGNAQVFRDLLSDKSSRVFSESYMAKGKHGVFVGERSKEEVALGIAALEEFCEWISDNCELFGGEAQTILNKEDKEKTLALFGQPALEALAVALKYKHVVWTDDYAIAECFQTLGGSGRIWTDTVFSFLAEKELIGKQELHDLKIHMVDQGYLFTRVDIGVIRRCMEVSGYDTTMRPGSSLVRYIWNSGVEAHGALGVAGAIIQECLANAALVHKRENAIGDVVASIGRRQDARDILIRLREVELPSFAHNIWASPLLKQRITQQISLLSRNRAIILPGDPDFGV